MAIDPPAVHFQTENTTTEDHKIAVDLDPTAPHPFEIALIRKLESKTKSVRDAFLLLDVDGDGRISPCDVRTVLHNGFELDITPEQERWIFSRFSNHNGDTDGCNSQVGMKYSEFAKYFNDVSNGTLTSSQAGSAAAVGFHIDDESGGVDHELPIHETLKTKRRRMRHQLRQTLSAHSSRTHGGSGMKETSLYLAIDVHRSGKVTMQEFLDWLKSVGIDWNMNELKFVILGCNDADDGTKLERHLFGIDNDGLECGKEAGMTEHEFAEFVESLDRDLIGDEEKSTLKEPQDSKGVLMMD
jgi:Ca2+-binding EF-hand superfamily protein